MEYHGLSMASLSLAGIYITDGMSMDVVFRNWNKQASVACYPCSNVQKY